MLLVHQTSNDAGPHTVSLGISFPLKCQLILPDDLLMPDLRGNCFMGTEADFNNMEPSIVQEPTKITQALDDESWVEAMQKELLRFKIQKVWTLVDLPYGKKAIGTKWVYRNKKDERGIVMDVKSAFLYDTIKEDVYVSQPLSFVDLEFPDKVYKVEKALYGLQQALRAWYETLTTLLICRTMDLAEDKYVGEILKKFGFSSVRTASTPMETNKALTKDEDDRNDLHYVQCSKISSSTKSFPLKCAFLDSDYAGASLDRNFTTGGCQFLGSRLISWQCKKQTVMANSTTEAEYIAASHCCGQVLWIQNQMLDYGYNFMQTKIYVNNESAICVVKNPVYHSKIKHIKIQHHFIRDSYEKRLIEMVKIHTDNNVADLLTKAFDVSIFNFLVASICMVNL
ncbi:putative ribonuclease H-like domain-containing protein [Tanacetum coccineum]